MSNIILVVDIETTGFLHEGGKIVEIGIVKLDLDARKIYPAYDSLIKEPGFDESHTKEPLGWIFRNSSLTFDEVMDAPSLESQRDMIQFLFDKYPATAYNKDFDFGYLKNRNFRIRELNCLMKIANPIVNVTELDADEFGIWTISKYPSVEETMIFFYGNKYKGEKHRGYDDAVDEAYIALELYRRGKLKLYSNLERPEKSEKPKKTINLGHLRNTEVLTPEIYDEILRLNKENNQNKLIPYRKGKNWGYCDSMGIIKIDCQFSEAMPFENGIAQIKSKDGKYGFINDNGKVIIPTIYSSVGRFHNGLVAVENDHKWGFLDKMGNVIIPTIFSRVNQFHDSLVAVEKERKWGYLDKMGNVITDFRFYYAGDFHDGLAAVCESSSGKVGYINKLGDLVLPYICNIFEKYLSNPVFPDVYYPSFSEGKAWIYEGDSGLADLGKAMFGYIDTSGKQIIDYEFKEAYDFKDGIARVKSFYTRRYYFIDENNRRLSSSYEKLLDFREGFSAFSRNKGWGFINKHFEEEIDPIYDEVSSFYEGLSRVKDSSGYGFINKNNEIQIPCQFGDSLGFFSEELASFSSIFNRKGYINSFGEIVIRPKYSQAGSFKNGIARTSDGFIDKWGNEFWED